MKLIIHADDFGLTRTITDNILDCRRDGALSSLSVVPNGHAFEYAISRIRHDPSLRVAVHLNLVEGKPVSPPDKVEALVDENGDFHHSFLSIWKAYVFGSQKTRAKLKEQVTLEIAAQLGRVRQALGPKRPLHVDGHLHIHCIPFVFESLLAQRRDFDIEYIRIPREPLFFDFESLSSVKNYFGSNIVKHFLLKALSRRCLRKIDGLKIQYPDYFVGVLFTGNMTMSSIERALKRIGANAQKTVEVLLHPGGASPEEAVFWASNAQLRDYYLSSMRRREKSVLLSDEFSSLVSRFQAGGK